MYEREDVRGVIKLAETGVLKFGESGGAETVGRYPLEEWEEAVDIAAKNPGVGKTVLLIP